MIAKSRDQVDVESELQLAENAEKLKTTGEEL